MRSLDPLHAEYIQRITRFAKFEHINLKPCGISQLEKARTKDTQALLDKAPNQSLIVICDERGKQYDTHAFSKMIEKTFLSFPNLCFIIGPAYGLDQKLIQVHNKLTLSKMTFQHEIAQLVLLEQIYRSLSLLNNHPYHVE